MPDLTKPKPIIQLVAKDSAAMIEKAETWLNLHGYGIHPLGEWEPPTALCTRLGISSSTLARKMKSGKCPKVKVDRGPSGRLLALISNPAFDKFCNAKEAKTNISREAGD